MIVTASIQTNKSEVRNVKTYAKNYIPLIFSLFLVLAISCLLQILRSNRDSGLYGLMNNFMGTFFIVFALPKLLDISGFTESFGQYDIIGRRYKLYAQIYPFIEISLGFCFLSKYVASSMIGSLVINVMVIMITGIALLGVGQSLRKKSNLSCACMGSFFKFPLSKVALVENSVMLVMALSMVIFASYNHMAMATMAHVGGL
jgi:hypothetical protein